MDKPSDAASPFRCGTVAIVGRPNVGKSTLLNALVGQKVSITSRKAQTTRHQIVGIRSFDHAQFIFVDTPGFQTRHRNALNRTLNRAVTASLSSVDLVLFVVEAGRLGPDDQQVLSLLSTGESAGAPVLLIVNKVDQIADKASLLPFLQQAVALHAFREIIPLSAKRPEHADYLLRTLKPLLPEGEPVYRDDDLTDRSEAFLAAEILREKLFRLIGDELPYTSTVLIDKWAREGRLTRIFATIVVDRSSHKAMVIGRKGTKLKQINTDARVEMEKLLKGPVYLEVWVKVKSGWADHEAGLRAYGYQ